MLEPLTNRLNDLRVILASSSKQRSNLLKRTRLEFEIIPSNFEENLDSNEFQFSDYVEETALGKAKEVYDRLQTDPKPPDLVIGVDTMVAFNGRMYGKPKCKEEAIKMLKDLTQKGLPHSVYTGVAVLYGDEKLKKFTEFTVVHMAQLTDDEITAYVETGEPMGKAGAYGIQGVAGTFIERIDGDVNNVIGLPLCRLCKVLKEILSELFP